MKVFIVIGVFLLLSCSQNEKNEKFTHNEAHIVVNTGIDSFKLYLDDFTLKMLPITFGEKELSNFPYDNPDLDTFFVNKFIQKNKIIVGDLSIYSSTKYYPLFKFKIDTLWAVIVMYSSGSGAIDDNYHLIIYDNSGHIESKLIIGKQIGDCEALETQTFLINPDYFIICKNNYFIGNCETGKMKLSKSTLSKYQIDKGGRIKS